MLASTDNVVFFRETHSVVVVRFSADKVNGQRTTVNSPWVCITNAHCLLSLVRKNPVDKVCCLLTVVCCPPVNKVCCLYQPKAIKKFHRCFYFFEVILWEVVFIERVGYTNLGFVIVNRQRSTVLGYASLVHEVCCPLTVVC